jgi:hypothetical protein
MIHDLGVAAFLYCFVQIGFLLGISAERRRVRGLEDHVDKLVERHRDASD